MHILHHLYLRAAVREAVIKFLIGEVPEKLRNDRSSVHVQAGAEVKGMELRVATVASQRACDSTEHDSVWESLEDQSVSEPYVKLWKETYDKQTRMVMIDVESDQFEIERRTKQGDPFGATIAMGRQARGGRNGWGLLSSKTRRTA